MRTASFPTVRVKRFFWRMLAPRWAEDPLSGAGSAKHGGRFNAPGQPALYMSEDFATAVSEYEQDLGIRPGLLCAYDVNILGIADLLDERVLLRLRVDAIDLRTPWKHVAFVQHRRPSTWDLAARLVAAGVSGARVPSVRGPGANLVLWRWNHGARNSVRVLDPLRDLAHRRSPGSR